MPLGVLEFAGLEQLEPELAADRVRRRVSTFGKACMKRRLPSRLANSIAWAVAATAMPRPYLALAELVRALGATEMLGH
jgi:hypothetical protein